MHVGRGGRREATARAAADFYQPRSTFLHYLHMARGNLRTYLKGEEVWVKKYFYVLRPLLALRWIERGLGAPALEFDHLVAAAELDPAVLAAIADLLAAKRAGEELDRGPRVAVLSDFVEAEIERLDSAVPERGELRGGADSAGLDRFFRSVIDAAFAPEGRSP